MILVVDARGIIEYLVIMTPNLSPIACIEQFHLLFLEQLGRKLDKRHYALKGGCNLRFYLRSVRYSEDMDLDVQSTPVNVLQERMDQILSGTALARILQARGLAITQVSAPKQTETTQRWKVALSARETGLPLHTKIEFSRRGMEASPVFEPVDSALMRDYQLTPFLASHYPPETAFRQKIDALIHRAQTQARDVFDLDHLLRMGVSTRGMVLPQHWRNAQENAMALTFGVFKAHVLAFLAPDHQAHYDDPQVWDEMVLRVVEALKGEPA